MLNLFCLFSSIITGIPLVYGEGLDFLLMADWGGQSDSPYYTTDEQNTAHIMGEIASNIPITAVFGIGDNFYDNGVASVSDPRFKLTFEDVFTAASLKDLPFYMIAGNHDYEQNVTAQIEYTNFSSRWKYPDYWYSVSWNIPDTSPTRTIEIIMIDTVILCGDQQDLEFCERHNIALSDCKINMTGPIIESSAKDQIKWIEQQLEQSSADFLIVSGHYPVYSIGGNGPTSCLVDQLEPMLIKYNVTAYVAGHDHEFEYINVPGQYVNYIVTGGAHECSNSTKHEDDIPKNSLKFNGCQVGGFVRLHVQDTLSFIFYFGSGTEVQYVTPQFQPRN